MGKRVKEEIICTVEYTEGADKAITSAFVDLYYAMKDGIYERHMKINDTNQAN